MIEVYYKKIEDLDEAIVDNEFLLKRINDTYGHNVGDAVLVYVADIMKSTIREIAGEKGEVFRWGGEEFIILLPKYDRKQTLELAEKIRYTIQESECVSDAAIIKVTMSFGVKEFDADKELEENLQIVDEKLYEAKRTGRNKVVM